MVFQEQEIEVEGVLTRYLTAREGAPLVLLHGVGDNALDWRWVMPTLARNHRVYAPDLPGSGASAKPAADRYSPAFFEQFVGALLDALGPSGPRWWATLRADSPACASLCPNPSG